MYIDILFVACIHIRLFVCFDLSGPFPPVEEQKIHSPHWDIHGIVTLNSKVITILMIGWERVDNFPCTDALSVMEVKVSFHQQKDVQIDLQRNQIQNRLTERSQS
jgi:hypothetical protein